MISPNALQLMRFEAEQKARTVKDLQLMICNFEKIAGELEAQVQAEELQTGIKDPTHASYSLFAKAARARCEKLRSSAGGLRSHLESAIELRDQSACQMMLTVGETPKECKGQPRSRRNPGGVLGQLAPVTTHSLFK
jgi:hypothetical protein